MRKDMNSNLIVKFVDGIDIYLFWSDDGVLCKYFDALVSDFDALVSDGRKWRVLGL